MRLVATYARRYSVGVCLCNLPSPSGPSPQRTVEDSARGGNSYLLVAVVTARPTGFPMLHGSCMKTTPGWARVQAICDFVHNHIAFGYGARARDRRVLIAQGRDAADVPITKPSGQTHWSALKYGPMSSCKPGLRRPLSVPGQSARVEPAASGHVRCATESRSVRRQIN